MEQKFHWGDPGGHEAKAVAGSSERWWQGARSVSGGGGRVAKPAGRQPRVQGLAERGAGGSWGWRVLEDGNFSSRPDMGTSGPCVGRDGQQGARPAPRRLLGTWDQAEVSRQDPPARGLWNSSCREAKMCSRGGMRGSRAAVVAGPERVRGSEGKAAPRGP